MLKTSFLENRTPSGIRLDLLIELNAPSSNPEPELVVSWTGSAATHLPKPWRFRLPHHRSSIQIIGPVMVKGESYKTRTTLTRHPNETQTIVRKDLSDSVEVPHTWGSGGNFDDESCREAPGVSAGDRGAAGADCCEAG